MGKLGALAAAVTKRARRGLYAGRRVLSGNAVSEDGGNRSRRAWRPNAQAASLWSDILGERLRLRVTAAALRDVDKAGGLDAYVLGTPDAKLASDAAAALRSRMLAALGARALRDAAGRLPPAAAAAAGAGAATRRREGPPEP